MVQEFLSFLFSLFSLLSLLSPFFKFTKSNGLFFILTALQLPTVMAKVAKKSHALVRLPKCTSWAVVRTNTALTTSSSPFLHVRALGEKVPSPSRLPFQDSFGKEKGN